MSHERQISHQKKVMNKHINKSIALVQEDHSRNVATWTDITRPQEEVKDKLS